MSRLALRIGVCAALGLALLSRPAAAQDAAIRGLLPAPNQIRGWVVQQPARLFTADRVYDYMDGAGEIPRGYGLRQLASAKYANGRTVLEAAVFDLADSEGAFGYYSARTFLERSPRSGGRLVPLGAHPGWLYGAVGVLTFWKDRYTVVLQPDAGKPDTATLLQFARAISRRIRPPGRVPALLARLPQANRIPSSEVFVRGKAAFDSVLFFSPKDVFGAAKGAVAAGADYHLDGASPTLFVVKYATGAGASESLGALRQLLVSRKAAFAPGPAEGAFSAVSGRDKGVAASAKGPYLAVVARARDAASARKALGSLLGSMR